MQNVPGQNGQTEAPKGNGLGSYRESLTESKKTCCPLALWVREQMEARRKHKAI